MKKGFKLLALTFALSFSLSAISASAFSDMPSGADGECLQRAVDNKLLTGFEDDSIRPGAEITRAQMAAIMVRALGADRQADISAYTDVPKSEWYFAVMSQAVAMDAFQGSDNKLNPTDSISRQEAMIVLSRVFDLPDADVSVLNKYSDGATVSDWAKNEVSKVVGGDFLPEAETLRPLDKMTRLEFAQIMDRLVTSYITESGEYTAENMPSGNVLVRAENVSFKGIKNDSMIFIGDGVKGKTSFTDCDMERIIVRGGTCIINSGQYFAIRAIGMNTRIDLRASASELLKVRADGTLGNFYGKPGRGSISLLPIKDVELFDAPQK